MERKNSNKIYEKFHLGEGSIYMLTAVSLKYIGMIILYINVGEICFIPINVHNELFSGVRRLRWQHLSPAVSKKYFILPFHKALHPSSLFLSLSVHLTLLSFCGTPISGLSLQFGDYMLMFSSSNPNVFAVRNIYYPVNTSSDNFHTDGVVSSSDHSAI